MVQALQGKGHGLFMGEHWKPGLGLLGAQVMEIVVITVWVVGTMYPLFYLLKMFNLLRISPETEIEGMDKTCHGGPAYDYHPRIGEEEGPQEMRPIPAIARDLNGLHTSETNGLP